MKASDRIVSIMMAAVVVLFAFLLLTTVGGNQRDGFQEGKEGKGTTNKPKGPQAQATNAEVKKATNEAKKDIKQEVKKVGATTTKAGTAKK